MTSHLLFFIFNHVRRKIVTLFNESAENENRDTKIVILTQTKEYLQFWKIAAHM